MLSAELTRMVLASLSLSLPVGQVPYTAQTRQMDLRRRRRALGRHYCLGRQCEIM